MRQYNLIDVVAGSVGVAGSVLTWALEPVSGIEAMKKNRGVSELKNLTNGPGKLCQALRITNKHNGVDLTSRRSSLYILSGEEVSPNDAGVSARIGISKSVDLPLRFVIKNSNFLSRIFQV